MLAINMITTHACFWAYECITVCSHYIEICHVLLLIFTTDGG